MKPTKKYVIALCIICHIIGYSQQISVDNSLTAQQLIDNTITGNCLEISNVVSSINGNSEGIPSFGYFQQGSSNFPFQDGLVISTGNANSAGNTTNNDVLNEGTPEWSTDADLENTLGLTNTINATSIEFDFISIANTVQFNYIYASEEYFANFPCQYSDAFAVLIREANTSNPYTNIALVPGTNLPVNSNTIHDTIEGFCDAENETYFDGYNIGDTNFNGRTTVLTAFANITPNVQYHIKLVIADQTDRNYDSAVFIEANSFNPAVDLGNDITTCAESVTLNGNINNPNAQYNWFLNDVPISGANQPDYAVLQSGTYRLEINVPLAGSFCTIEDEIVVNLSNTQTSVPMTDMVVCDDLSNDGVETFNLNTKDSEAINSVAPGNYVISYHTSLNDAQNNSNPISGNYNNTSNPEIIFVRIDDVDNGCLAFNQFQLQVNQRPVITQPPLLEVCDDQIVDGFTTIDLNIVDDDITNGQPHLDVSYHYTLSDADLGINAIPLPYVNDSVNDMVYVSVTDIQTGCISTTTLDIAVLAPPVLADNDNYYIDACDSDYDGFANFDLTILETEILNGLTNVSVSYHTTPADALSGENPIPNPTSFTNTIQTEQIVFIRVVDNTTGCPSIAPIEIHPNLLLSGPDFSESNLCDNDNDGSEPFNLLNLTGEILGDIPNVSITFYETENDRDNNVNALDTNVNYYPPNDPQTLYLTLTSPTCTEDEEIVLSLFPVVEFPDVDQQTFCDEDQDGLTIVDLSDYDSLFVQNQSGYTVTYFETQTDAESNTNQVSNFYSNTTNPFTVFGRIQSTQTGCTDVSSIEILVNPAPETTAPSPIIICDNDQDGMFIINLNNTIPELVSSTDDRNFTFYNSQADANSGSNPILDPTVYNAETETVYVRIENTVTGCISTESISVIVNTLPVFIEISDYRFCEDNTDNIGEFLLSSKDTEILNGQSGKEVLYFLTENDALTGTNPIDKYSNFENTSNPQTIYVRVQNVTDNDCFGTSSFTLEVGTNPEFNQPADIFLCDDASNDTFVTIDLNEKITEISDGINDNLNVVVFRTLEDLQSGNNPINGGDFTNTTNPQELFVEISNGSICTSMTSFIINVIPVPTVTEIMPFEACDDDYDGSITWNLTDAEVNIQDIRQDNIIVEYYETLALAETGTNPITTPESFTNTVNPQTVFVKVTNTDFNCPIIIPIGLQVNLPPAINDFQLYEICDNDDNTFQLNTINSIIVNDVNNTAISYYNNEQDALDSLNPLNSIYNYQSNDDIIYARVENTISHCFIIYPFMLVVNDIPVASMPQNLEDCDDDFDGRLVFDLTTQNASILNGLDATLHEVTYHENQVQAETGNNPVPNVYNAFNNQTLFARVTNTITQCHSTTQFNIVIHPLPLTNIENQTLCPENFPLTVSADTGFPNDTYAWSTGDTSTTIDISEVGTYSVTVTTPNGCSITNTFEVIESEPATIEVVETIDFSDPNNITITITGIGDYLFQLDDGLPQTSNIFENVTLGYHTLTIIDQNGCSSVTREVVVIDAPKFLTPNNDGAFDTWHISGVETLPGTVVNIFDRYGKLIKQLNHTSLGWDGTYNGNLMPTSDYWFSAEVRQNGEAFTVKGHFTLKR